ncbi:acyl-CoA dehydrogenase [Nocardia sp. ET3-3]|uniref:Acyl-CoA dehydrogenase n=2 Tax=Nocardia terrae TaxID=2675851 RepID=A0A7K1V2F8_9NOCA|nr:acyl-CoA dehydrogenase [Nocardia terrae]
MSTVLAEDSARLNQDELRSTVRELATTWCRDGRYVPQCDSWMRSFDLDFSRELAARGFIGMTWPRSYGGGEYRNVDRLAVTEELLRAGAPVAAHWIADRQIGPAILRHGSDRLRAEILPGITRAEILFCLGMSEPEAGSDLAAVRTAAERVPGGWRITGRKIWTTGAHHATHAYVLARTAKADRKHLGLSEFVVDMHAVGVEVTPIVDMSGEHHFNETMFDGVFVPDHHLIGTEGEGWKQVVEQLSFERGGPERLLSTYPLLASIVERADEVHDRNLHGRLGALVARLTALRRMCWDVARQLDAGQAPIQEAATLKLLGNTFERDVIEFAREALGGNDNAPDSLLNQALLAAPGFSIRGGAADVLLSIIAKQESRI